MRLTLRSCEWIVKAITEKVIHNAVLAMSSIRPFADTPSAFHPHIKTMRSKRTCKESAAVLEANVCCGVEQTLSEPVPAHVEGVVAKTQKAQDNTAFQEV